MEFASSSSTFSFMEWYQGGGLFLVRAIWVAAHRVELVCLKLLLDSLSPRARGPFTKSVYSQSPLMVILRVRGGFPSLGTTVGGTGGSLFRKATLKNQCLFTA